GGAFRIEDRRAALGAPPAGTVWAGASKVDITPDRDHVYMAGFMVNRTSLGVHDPIYARCLYVDDGRTPLVMISLDLLGFLHSEVVGMRARMTERFGPNVIVASTHSHSGPDIIGLWGFGLLLPFSSGKDDAFVDRVMDAGAQCVRQAMDAAVPATAVFAAADAPADISTNFHEPERPGIAKEKDNQIAVARWISRKGETVATVINYACHVEAIHEENREITADFAGFLTRDLEQRFGGVGLFFNGAIGGLIVPNIPRPTPTQERWDLARRMGQRLVDAARDALEKRGIPWSPGPGDGIEVVSRDLPLSLDNAAWRFFRFVGILGIEGEGRDFMTELTAARIGPSVWLTVPGEIFPSLGRKFKAAMAARVPFLIGLGNDELGYIMEPAEFVDDLYGYE
ncbi:MAG: neutral/alkaline non-lysosomal ceramidase N-terminal domain-containing protein, partial [Myxococcales bacterium]|nr:neutral/alkaline non-lysosomal ceramidase N-terminal domain-containing protein [Myxococcales bacterium]